MKLLVVVLAFAGCGAATTADMGMPRDFSGNVVNAGPDLICTDVCPAGKFHFAGSTVLDDGGAPFPGCNFLPDACNDCSCLRYAYLGVCSCQVCAGGTLSVYCVYPGPA